MPRFISVGGDRQTAAQIYDLKYTPNTYFFDQLSIPISGAVELVDNDFSELLLPKNLHPVYVDDGLVGVLDMRYRIEFAHDFEQFTAPEIAAVQARYAMHVDRFRALFDDDEPAPYFVRRWTPGDGPEDESVAMQLFELLRQRRQDIRMLYLHGDARRGELISGAYRSAYLPPPEVPHWIGNTGSWQYMLRDFALRDDNTSDLRPAAIRPKPRFVR